MKNKFVSMLVTFIFSAILHGTRSKSRVVFVVCPVYVVLLCCVAHVVACVYVVFDLRACRVGVHDGVPYVSAIFVRHDDATNPFHLDRRSAVLQAARAVCCRVCACTYGVLSVLL